MNSIDWKKLYRDITDVSRNHPEILTGYVLDAAERKHRAETDNRKG